MKNKSQIKCNLMLKFEYYKSYFIHKEKNHKFKFSITIKYVLLFIHKSCWKGIRRRPLAIIPLERRSFVFFTLSCKFHNASEENIFYLLH